MDAMRNGRIRAIFDAAVDQPAHLQADLIWKECGADEDLARAVWRLLDANRNSAGFLSRPSWQPSRAPQPTTSVGSTIGPYRLLRELGAGGMGIVYQAVRADEVFRRVVALKLIRPGSVTDTLVSVFQQERQTLADLDHVNIARIIDGGSTSDGDPYFVMDYVEGVAIDAFCRLHSLTLVQRLSLFRQVCAATRYLHENRVVHSDLKPSNLLVTHEGTVKILDFGIARAMDRTGIVHHDIPLMTPGYASPEQIRGDAPDFASDVYSLGVVLYELLTGAKPIKASRPQIQSAQGSGPCHLLSPSEAVHTGSALPAGIIANNLNPGRLQRTLRGDIDSLVMKALEPEPAKRYSSVLALDADIRRFLAGRPVLARRAGVLYRSLKFTRRNRLAIASSLVLAALLMIIGWQSIQLQQNQQIRRADEMKIKMLQKRAISDLASVQSAATSNKPGTVAAPPHRQVFDKMQMRDLQSLQHGYRFSFPEAIHIWPGWTPGRRELLTEAHRYLHQAEPLTTGEGRSRLELARAWLLVGNVEGDPSVPSLGDREAAGKSYSQSTRILHSLLQTTPNDLAAQQLLAQVTAAVHRLRPVGL